jgi:hypothetical protein
VHGGLPKEIVEGDDIVVVLLGGGVGGHELLGGVTRSIIACVFSRSFSNCRRNRFTMLRFVFLSFAILEVYSLVAPHVSCPCRSLASLASFEVHKGALPGLNFSPPTPHSHS